MSDSRMDGSNTAKVEVKKDLVDPIKKDELDNEPVKINKEEVNVKVNQDIDENKEKPVPLQSSSSNSDMEVDDLSSIHSEGRQEEKVIISPKITNNEEKVQVKSIFQELKTLQPTFKQDLSPENLSCDLQDIMRKETEPIETKERDEKIEISKLKCKEEKPLENPQEFDLALFQLSKKGIFQDNVKFQIEERKSLDDQLSIKPEIMQGLTTTPVKEEINQKSLKEKYIDQLLELTKKMQEIQRNSRG